MYHPWRELRSLPAGLYWTDDLSGATRGVTDGVDVWMRPGMSQVQRRCTLAHELTHVRRGHRGCQPEAVEGSVRREAARLLLPDARRVGEELAWAHSLHEAADHLWVTTEVLMYRLAHLHPAERAIITDRVAAVERGA